MPNPDCQQPEVSPETVMNGGVIFAQTSDLGVCHLRLVGVVVQRDVNKF